jgi:hypothetical protein
MPETLARLVVGWCGLIRPVAEIYRRCGLAGRRAADWVPPAPGPRAVGASLFQRPNLGLLLHLSPVWLDELVSRMASGLS